VTARLVQDNAKRLRGEFAALGDDELRTLADLLARLLSVQDRGACPDLRGPRT